MVDTHFVTAEIRRGKKKKKERRKKPEDENMMACPIYRAAIMSFKDYSPVIFDRTGIWPSLSKL